MKSTERPRTVRIHSMVIKLECRAIMFCCRLVEVCVLTLLI